MGKHTCVGRKDYHKKNLSQIQFIFYLNIIPNKISKIFFYGEGYWGWLK